MVVSEEVRRFQSGQVLTEGCPTREVLRRVTSKWGVLVLLALSGRTLRWGELRRAVDGISEKMLASTLRDLDADGFVRRDAQPTIPPRVDYRLTPLGDELVERLGPLVEWVAGHAGDIVLRRPTAEAENVAG